MSVLNGEKYIVDSLDSVIKQSHKEFEFIIINNGSIDKTSKILNDFAKKDNRIKIINQTTTPWAEAINKAIRLSKGDWIARMDPDDIMHPRRIEKQVAFIKKNKGLAVASSFVYLIDPSNRIIGQTKSDLVDESVLRKKVDENKIIGLAHPAVIMKKESYISIGGYRGQFWPCEDVDLWTRIAQNGGKILVQPEYLLSYRLHNGSISRQSLLTNLRKAEWVKMCASCRKINKIEPTYEEFKNSLRNLPFLYQLNIERKLYGKYFYKLTVNKYIEKDFIKAFAYMFICLIIRPKYLLVHILGKSKLFRIFHRKEII